MNEAEHTIQTEENGNVVTSQVSSFVLQLAPILFAFNPTWQVLFLTAGAMINAWGAFGQNRVNELVDFITENKEEFMADVLGSDKFKAVFLTVLELHMKETNEKRRQLLRNYLLNVGRNYSPEFDDHTKLIYTINTISFDELGVLQLWESGGVLEEWRRKRNVQNMALTVSAIQGALTDLLPRDDPRIGMFPFGWEGRDKNNQILLSLGHKDLLYVLSENNFGSGEEVRARNITSFGEKFLNFIKNT